MIVIDAGSFSRHPSSFIVAGVRATSALHRHRLLTSFIALSLTLQVAGAAHAQKTPDLSSLSVDDLMNVEVTSVSRKGQKARRHRRRRVRDHAGRHSPFGATSIPEILRIVPGLDVCHPRARPPAGLLGIGRGKCRPVAASPRPDGIPDEESLQSGRVRTTGSPPARDHHRQDEGWAACRIETSW